VTSDDKTGVTDPAKAEVAAAPKSTVPETPEPAAAHAGSSSTGAPPRTLQEVEAAFKAFFNAKGVQPARELFAKFKIARITELQPEQYAEFVDACSR
jgi:hypothetical protein